MLTERRGDHHDVHRAHRRQCLVQIGVQVHAVDDRRVQADSGVDGCYQVHQTLIFQASDPLGVDPSESLNADQDKAGWRA